MSFIPIAVMTRRTVAEAATSRTDPFRISARRRVIKVATDLHDGSVIATSEINSTR
jgi:hypothetical protein